MFHGAERTAEHRQEENARRQRRLREYHAMHEENFLSSWMREDVEGKEEERARLNEEAEQEESKRGKREVAVCPDSEVDSVWECLGFFGVCACGVSVCACGDCSFSRL